MYPSQVESSSGDRRTMKKTKPSKVSKNKEVDIALARSFFNTIAESAFINGDLNIEDFSDKKLLREKILRLIPKEDKNIYFTIDHTPTLLEKGEWFAKNEEYNLAYVFYATYFEHFINEILDMWATRNSIKYETSSLLIKKVTLEDKYTWLLEVLKLPTFKQEHWKTIKKLSDKRNSFIHYKYKPEAADRDDSKDKTEWTEDYKDIIKTITYTRRYRSKIVFNGKKQKFNLLKHVRGA